MGQWQRYASSAMTDLESAILDVLRKALPSAMILTDIHAELVRRGWDVYLITPQRITDALVSLEDVGLARNELAWYALIEAPK